MSFIGSTTSYPTVAAGDSDLLPNVQGGVLKTSTVASVAARALGGATLDTDATLAANSDARVASQKATKAYVDGLHGFRTIAVSGQSDVVADTATDTLTLVAGANVTLTTNAAADSVTIATAGSGSVTSVAATVPSFLSISGSPITTSGTLAISYSGTALPVANGGTGATTLTANNVILGNGTSAVGFVAPGANGNVLTSNGTTWTSAAPSAGSSGTKTYGVFTPMTSQPPASNFATLDTRNSIAVLDFNATVEESIFWVAAMPEGASLGSGLKVRIHWTATSATSGDVVWGASFERMNTDLDADSFDTETTGTSTTNATSGIATLTEITCTAIDGIAAGDIYRLKVARKAAAAGDTMTGDAEVLCVELRSAA